MYKAQKIVIGFLLMAVFASGCSGPTESEKDKLTARKEHLISKLSDSISELYLIPAGHAERPEMTEKLPNIKNICRVTLTALCGALESKDAVTITKDLAEFLDDSPNPTETKQILAEIDQYIINAGAISTEDFCYLATRWMGQLPGDDGSFTSWMLGSEQQEKLDIIRNDVATLLEVVKEIRELH